MSEFQLKFKRIAFIFYFFILPIYSRAAQKTGSRSRPCRMDLDQRLYHTLTWSALIFLLPTRPSVLVSPYFASYLLHLSHFRSFRPLKVCCLFLPAFFLSGVAFLRLFAKSVFGVIYLLVYIASRIASCE